MDSFIANFLKSQKVCVLSVMLPDGHIRGAAMHYAFDSDTQKIYMMTRSGSTKMQGLKKPGDSVEASVVVGFSEEEWTTMQIQGVVKKTEGADMVRAVEVYSKVFGEAGSGDEKKDAAVLEFDIRWWRYSKFKPEPPVILESK